MADIATINTQFFLSFFIIALGYLLKKIKILSEKDGGSLSKLIINLTLPALILKTVSNIDLDPTLVLMPFICVIFSVIIFLIATKVFKNETGQIKGVLIMTSIGFNIGLFAYPLIEGIYGNLGLVNIAMFDVGNAFMIFGLNYTLASIYANHSKTNNKKSEDSENPKQTINLDFKTILKKAITNIPLMSYIVALLINIIFGGIDGFAYNFLSTIANANEAVVLIVLGLFLNFDIDKNDLKRISKVLILRYSSGIIIGFALYFLLPFNEMFRTIILISFILPIGMAVIPFVVQFDYEEKAKKLTGAIVNLTIVISFVLMWILIMILNI